MNEKNLLVNSIIQTLDMGFQIPSWFVIIVVGYFGVIVVDVMWFQIPSWSLVAPSWSLVTLVESDVDVDVVVTITVGVDFDDDCAAIIVDVVIIVVDSVGCSPVFAVLEM